MAKPTPVAVTLAVVGETRIVDALERVEARLCRIEARLDQIAYEQITHDLMEETQMSDLENVVADLETRVSEMTDVQESAATALGTLGAKVDELTDELANAGVDPALIDRLRSLGTIITDEDGKLAEAIAANTDPQPTDTGTATGDTGDVDAGGNPI